MEDPLQFSLSLSALDLKNCRLFHDRGKVDSFFNYLLLIKF